MRKKKLFQTVKLILALSGLIKECRKLLVQMGKPNGSIILLCVILTAWGHGTPQFHPSPFLLAGEGFHLASRGPNWSS